jgi:signal transduction histidine kinase
MTKIMIIEDETQIREEVVDWLQFEGYKVLGAANGVAGLALMRQSPPDLILCDIAMPEMNGYDVLVEVRANPLHSHIPFIFLTAAVDRPALRRGMELGADDYITKPFTHAEVLKAIRVGLTKHAAHVAQQQQQITALQQALLNEHEQRLLKSRLIAMFSHDFRNPLAALLSFVQLMSRHGERLDAQRQQRYLQRMESSVYTLLQMLDDLLMAAEVEGGHLTLQPQPLALADWCAAQLEELRLIDQNAHLITLEHQLPDQPLPADPKLLRHILVNLVGNALKYSPPASVVHVQLDYGANRLHVSVQDQGIGIPAAELPRLFTPFYRASNAQQLKGTGLGLALVQACVTAYAGQIFVESTVGQGTTFRVELPIAVP